MHDYRISIASPPDYLGLCIYRPFELLIPTNPALLLRAVRGLRRPVKIPSK